MDGFGVLATFLASIIAYLIGSINWSIIIGKTVFKIDVRQYHSKNAGATNASRVMGVKWGFIIMILDMLKVSMTMLIALAFSYIYFNEQYNFAKMSYFIPTLVSIIGHCYPVFFKFKGGKAFSPFLGLLWMTNPYYFLIASTVWWGLFFAFKKVSLSSIMAAFIIACLCWIPQLSGVNSISTDPLSLQNSNLMWFNQFHRINEHHQIFWYETLITINTTVVSASVLLIIKHHQNIARLIKGEEKSYRLKKREKQVTSEIKSIEQELKLSQKKQQQSAKQIEKLNNKLVKHESDIKDDQNKREN